MNNKNLSPVLQSFPVVADANAEILVLGSMPGVRSLQQQKYYAHPQNAFWPIVNEIFQLDPTLGYDARLVALQAHRFALWDVLKHCVRDGSLDSSIQTDSIVPNDFASLFEQCPNIKRIAFNGQKAEQLFLRHVQPKLKLPASLSLVRLPSTSPAYAAMRFEQKLDCWRQALRSVE